MNFQEINELIKKHYGEDVSEFAFADDGSIPGVGKFKEIAQEGGEGEGEAWFSVKHFPEQNTYVRIDGSYASYDGTSFDDWESAVKQVTPKEKTITVYE